MPGTSNLPCETDREIARATGATVESRGSTPGRTSREAGPMTPRILACILIVSIASCAPPVKVFDTRADFLRAVRDGTVKQGDRVAVREGNLDDVPGLTGERR